MQKLLESTAWEDVLTPLTPSVQLGLCQAMVEVLRQRQLCSLHAWYHSRVVGRHSSCLCLLLSICPNTQSC